MLSIVTVNKNNALGLSKTIDSLNFQSNQDFQWILIDGNSCDSSLQVAKNFVGHDVFIISERDLGIYDAMNKSIKLCKYSFILFLNSGDVFSNKCTVADLLAINLLQFDIVLGGFSVRGKTRFPKPNWWRYWSLPTSHQSIIYTKMLLLKNPFNISYRRAADFEHYLRINKSDIHIGVINSCLVTNEPYGSDNFLPLVLEEYGRALIENDCPWLWAAVVKFVKKYYLKVVLR